MTLQRYEVIGGLVKNCETFVESNPLQIKFVTHADALAYAEQRVAEAEDRLANEAATKQHGASGLCCVLRDRLRAELAAKEAEIARLNHKLTAILGACKKAEYDLGNFFSETAGNIRQVLLAAIADAERTVTGD